MNEELNGIIKGMQEENASLVNKGLEPRYNDLDFENVVKKLFEQENPNQILLSIKKILDKSKLVSQKTNSNYQQEFRQLGMLLNQNFYILLYLLK